MRTFLFCAGLSLNLCLCHDLYKTVTAPYQRQNERIWVYYISSFLYGALGWIQRTNDNREAYLTWCEGIVLGAVIFFGTVSAITIMCIFSKSGSIGEKAKWMIWKGHALQILTISICNVYLLTQELKLMAYRRHGVKFGVETTFDNI